MTFRPVTRRRAVGISAAATGLALLPFGPATHAEAHLLRWHGNVLGAPASMQIHHHDQAVAQELLDQSLREIQRLESVFSLYRDDSALVSLNRHGVAEAPPPELVELLLECRRYAMLTSGAFDPSVQPLWTLYAGHFSQKNADPAGPASDALAAALDKTGFHHVLVNTDRIAFARPGMALTLNGIVQGYFTDRVVNLLHEGGIERSLVDLGEGRALGGHPDGRPWQVGIADPDDPARMSQILPLQDQAIATSGSYGFRFDADGQFNHLFDPKTGRCARRYRSITVIMPTAAAADALSTAFNLMPIDTIGAVLRNLHTGSAHVTTADGRKMVLGT
jgi:thiamine biosynthesis lipoprotein